MPSNMSRPLQRNTPATHPTPRPKITLDALTHLQPLVLLQMMASASQTVNTRVSSSQALARSLLLSGRQRLQDLVARAPRLHLPVEQVLEFCRAGGAEDTPEQTAAWALLELCLAMILLWMAETARKCHAIAAVCRRQPDPLPYLSHFLTCPPRARSCLTFPLA